MRNPLRDFERCLLDGEDMPWWMLAAFVPLMLAFLVWALASDAWHWITRALTRRTAA